MSFPSQVTHRRSRRKLGRGQSPAIPPVTATVSSTGGSNMRLTFNRPVVVNGTLGTTVATRNLVSQTVVSPTVLDQTWSGAVTGLAWTVPAAAPQVTGAQGGALAGSSGTFP